MKRVAKKATKKTSQRRAATARRAAPVAETRGLTVEEVADAANHLRQRAWLLFMLREDLRRRYGAFGDRPPEMIPRPGGGREPVMKAVLQELHGEFLVAGMLANEQRNRLLAAGSDAEPEEVAPVFEQDGASRRR